VRNLKLHLLCDGFFTLDKSFLVYMKYAGQPYEAAVKPLLITTPQENVLIDTGIGDLPEKYRKFYTIKRTPEQNLKTQLAQHGLKPEDIGIVINTHLHFDHCGNNKLFPNAKIYVQAEEFRYAQEPERFQQASYIKELFDVKAHYKLIQGQQDVTKEVSVIPTPGHSIGHQSVAIKSSEANYVYCGDAAPIKECLEKRNIPGVLYSSHEALTSIDRLKSMNNALYIFSHDNDQLSL
jgi:glyoxylase-like metal-dependent hydrolase (beta-lactamase superfamily II)